MRGAARVIGVRRDQDVTFELLSAWRRMQRLYEQLDERAKRRAGAAGDVSARLLQEQLKIATALDVTHLIARAYAALARIEPVTVGGRTPRGRRSGPDRSPSGAGAGARLAGSALPDWRHPHRIARGRGRRGRLPAGACRRRPFDGRSDQAGCHVTPAGRDV